MLRGQPYHGMTKACLPLVVNRNDSFQKIYANCLLVILCEDPTAKALNHG